jgi:hypothetical protein
MKGWPVRRSSTWQRVPVEYLPQLVDHTWSALYRVPGVRYVGSGSAGSPGGGASPTSCTVVEYGEALAPLEELVIRMTYDPAGTSRPFPSRRSQTAEKAFS